MAVREAKHGWKDTAIRMVVLTILVGIILALWALSKLSVNTKPEKSEEQEAAGQKAAAKHQFWQTMDYTEPWNDIKD